MTSKQTGTKVSLDAEQLRGVWLLDALDVPTRRALLEHASLSHFATGDMLYRAGSHAGALHVVLSGRVRVVRERHGKTLFIHDETRGGCLGEVPLFEGTTYPASAIASEPTECLVIQRDAMLRVVSEHPALALKLLERLAARVRRLVDRMDGNATLSTRTRLARLLLARAPATPGRAFTLGVTQQQVAEELGTVRELVVRGLRTLRDAGVVRAAGGGRYVIVDADALRQIALDP